MMSLEIEFIWNTNNSHAVAVNKQQNQWFHKHSSKATVLWYQHCCLAVSDGISTDWYSRWQQSTVAWWPMQAVQWHKAMAITSSWCSDFGIAAFLLLQQQWKEKTFLTVVIVPKEHPVASKAQCCSHHDNRIAVPTALVVHQWHCHCSSCGHAARNGVRKNTKWFINFNDSKQAALRKEQLCSAVVAALIINLLEWQQWDQKIAFSVMWPIWYWLVI